MFIFFCIMYNIYPRYSSSIYIMQGRFFALFYIVFIYQYYFLREGLASIRLFPDWLRGILQYLHSSRLARGN
jgi:hypothetical protein